MGIKRVRGEKDLRLFQITKKDADGQDHVEVTSSTKAVKKARRSGATVTEIQNPAPGPRLDW